MNEALQIAREIGWRSGETHILFNLGFHFGAKGRYHLALQAAQMSWEIAQEMHHREWMAGALCALGSLYMDLGNLPRAQEQLEQALNFARESHSEWWIFIASGFLASVLTSQGQVDQAQMTLNPILHDDTPARTPVQRVCWIAQAELNLLQGDITRAMRILERLMASTANLSTGVVVPRIWKLRGEALARQNRVAEAEIALSAAKIAAKEQGMLPLVWRIQGSLFKLYQGQGRWAMAEEERSDARLLIEELAATVPNEELRKSYMEWVNTVIPPSSLLSARQSLKHKYAGLTTREREIANYIAKGKSNREIAQELVLSERTVEVHISNILAKLEFTSRSQVAVWVSKKGVG
jgi:DNA-binding CsgD family transcriptional regulator/predicted negative regulator of RcsB-dependent stress response